MSAVTWTHVSEAQPADGQAVEVITPGGDQRDLVYERGLWWLPDRSMYVYFVPSFWRTPSPSLPTVELELLVDFARPRNGTVGVPAGWITRAEVEALVEHGVATCPDCEVRITRCDYCGPGEAHCDCTQPSDCAAEDHRLDVGDQQRAEAKESGR